MPPPLTDRKIRIQFQKSLNKGECKNAQLDPAVPSSVQQMAEPDETFVVRVDITVGSHYWFSNLRVLQEHQESIDELFRYDAVKGVHWISKDVFSDPRAKSEFVKLKRDHYDRLEVEMQSGLALMGGPDQAYWPTLHFLWWLTRDSRGS